MRPVPCAARYFAGAIKHKQMPAGVIAVLHEPVIG
jgi:hypothetical protein